MRGLHCIARLRLKSGRTIGAASRKTQEAQYLEYRARSSPASATTSMRYCIAVIAQSYWFLQRSTWRGTILMLRAGLFFLSSSRIAGDGRPRAKLLVPAERAHHAHGAVGTRAAIACPQIDTGAPLPDENSNVGIALALGLTHRATAPNGAARTKKEHPTSSRRRKGAQVNETVGDAIFEVVTATIGGLNGCRL